MPRRTLLSPTQRTQFVELPTTPRELIHHYTLTENDLVEIKRHRRPYNRLGFAIQLCYLRYPGQSLQAGEKPREELLTFVSEQIQVDQNLMDQYAIRDQTRREHLVKLQNLYGFQPFTMSLYRDLSVWLLPTAIKTDKGSVLVASLLDEMRHRKIIVPALIIVERLGATTRHRAQRQIFRTLTNNLTKTQKIQLDDLLKLRPETRKSQLAWIRDPAGKPSPASFLKRTERLSTLRKIGLDLECGQRIHQNRLLQMAREGSQISVQHLQRLDEEQRHAILVIIALEMMGTLTDEALDMHDRMIGNMFRRSERKHSDVFQSKGKAINEKVRLYAKIGKALIDARKADLDPFQVIQEILSWDQFTTSVEEAEELAQPERFDFISLIKTRYPQIRRYAPTLLKTFEFMAAPSRNDLLEAIKILKKLNRSGRRLVPNTAPTGFISSRWKPYIFQEDSGINRCYYELCVLTELRNSLRSGDIWIVGSRQFKDFEEYLLPQDTFQEMHRSASLSIFIETKCSTYLAHRQKILHEQMETVSKLSAKGELPDVEIRDKTLHITPLKKAVPDGVSELSKMAYALLPRIKITELLMEVDAWTGMSDHFTHLRSGEPQKDNKILLTAILADGINLGLGRMAEACPDASLDRLCWTTDWYIREEAYGQALAEMVNFHHKIPFSKHWGTGSTSSSDGQYFRAGGHGKAIGSVNARYGNDPGITFYTHISDQYSPFHIQVINATAKDATYVLDGLLYHESDLRIEEHYTDTAGFTEHVFALCHILGFRFAPRIRDLGDKRLYPFKNPENYQELESLIGGKVNIKHIEKSWDEVLRLASSIQSGTVTASVILRKLGAYPRQNGLAVALREIGRIERTLFILEWLQNPELRRRVQIGLNKGEAKNALARAVFFNRLGEVRDRSFENQHHRASGLNLIVTSIILWNTIYLAKAVNTLRQQGMEISDEHLKHLSPLGWEHINLTGDYFWHLNHEPNIENLRPLRSNN